MSSAFRPWTTLALVTIVAVIVVIVVVVATFIAAAFGRAATGNWQLKPDKSGQQKVHQIISIDIYVAFKSNRL